jgi:hypothetical protein
MALERSEVECGNMVHEEVWWISSTDARCVWGSNGLLVACREGLTPSCAEGETRMAILTVQTRFVGR